MKIGDKVRVVADVWDDQREKSWIGWEGRVLATDSKVIGPYKIYVTFPRARGKWTTFDFLPEELEVL